MRWAGITMAAATHSCLGDWGGPDANDGGSAGYAGGLGGSDASFGDGDESTVEYETSAAKGPGFLVGSAGLLHAMNCGALQRVAGVDAGF